MRSDGSLFKHKERVKMKMFMEIDKIAGMMENGRMTIIAGRPSVGKTSFAISLLAEVALKKEQPLSMAMFSMKMTGKQLTKRLLCSEAQVSERELTGGSISNTKWKKITSAATSIMRAKIFIDPTPSLKVTELRAKARRLRKKEKLGLIIIDYLQLMCGKTVSKSKTRQIKIPLISAGIKKLAMELDLPILVLAQLGMDSELRRDAKPRLSDLGGTDTIEQDADIVAFLHRDIREQDKSSKEKKCKGLCAELMIVKNRFGETGTVPLLYFPDTMSFRPKLN